MVPRGCPFSMGASRRSGRSICRWKEAGSRSLGREASRTAGGLHRHIVLICAKLDGNGADRVDPAEYGLAGKVVKAVFQQVFALSEIVVFHCVSGGVLPVDAAQDHPDHRAAVLFRGGCQTIACLRSGAGFDADGILIEEAPDPEVGHQSVGVVEDPFRMEVGGGNSVAHRGDDLAEVGVLHGLQAHPGHVPGGGVVVVVVVAVGIHKVRARHAQFGGALIHQVHKGRDASGNQRGQGVTGLIGRGDEGAVQQVPDGEDLPRLQILGGAALPDAGVEVISQGDLGVQGQLAPVYRLRSQKAGHHLGDAGGEAALVGVLFVEDLVVVGVQQQGGGGVDGKAVAFLCGEGRGQKGGQQAQQQKKSGDRTVFFHRKLLSGVLY